MNAENPLLGDATVGGRDRVPNDNDEFGTSDHNSLKVTYVNINRRS